MSDAAALSYPIELDGAAVQRLLPHRGEMQLVRRITVLAHNHYRAVASWPAGSEVLAGHFPGMPLVPGVLLIEAVAQAAGAGMLAGDSYAIGMGGEFIGVLAGVRKCSFRRPVLPGEEVSMEIHCRQMTPTAAGVNGECKVNGEDTASIEILVINTPRAEIGKHLEALRKANA